MKMKVKAFFVSWCLLTLAVAISSSSSDEDLMTDMTEAVFGTQASRNIFPMAFLDFDGDRLTDLIVISENSKTLSVYLAVKQSFLGIKAPYYDTNIKGKNMDCHIPNGKIVSVVPGDYDGDGFSDILVVVKKPDTENLFTSIIWTNRAGDMKSRILNCSTLLDKWIEMAQQPIVLDANGDNIADLFGVDQDNIKGFWIFSSEQGKPPVFVAAEPVAGAETQTKNGNGPHSNAFVDLNGDGNADLLLSNKNKFEIWQNVGGLSSVAEDSQSTNKSDVPGINFRFHRMVDINNCDGKCLVGQVSFSDFDMNGGLDMLVPVCQDGLECRQPAILFGRVEEVFREGADFNFEKVELNLGNWTFDFRTENLGDPFRLLTPRPGDLNLDGYPDLLLRMKNTITEEATTHFLLSIGHEISEGSKFGRAFQLQAEIMSGLSNVIAATFFDIYDNGILDILTLTEDKTRHTYTIGAYSNRTLTSSGYFMKVIVLSGICYKNCADEETTVPYGTNMPGQIVCYKTQGNNLAPETSAAFDSCMPQLTMTAHTPLQLPYTHFGLGSNLNFIESLGVKVTNASSRSESRVFHQVLIPNAQLYVIPYPPQDAESWKLKLFITASSSIMWTALTLVIGAVIMIFFIVGFIFQEKKVDRLEKLNDRGKYHFTPM